MPSMKARRELIDKEDDQEGEDFSMTYAEERLVTFPQTPADQAQDSNVDSFINSLEGTDEGPQQEDARIQPTDAPSDEEDGEQVYVPKWKTMDENSKDASLVPTMAFQQKSAHPVEKIIGDIFIFLIVLLVSSLLAFIEGNMNALLHLLSSLVENLVSPTVHGVPKEDCLITSCIKLS